MFIVSHSPGASLADPVPARGLPIPMPSTFAAHPPDDACRAEVEAFIQQVYARRFDADVTPFTPTLVSLRDQISGQLVAAAGYRQAESAPLFLERYLDQPVEALLAPLAGPQQAPPPRSAIVEIGHLAAARSGEGPRLVHLLTRWLAAQHVGWVVSTLTREVLHLFHRLGLRPQALAPAPASRLGSVDEHAPRVFAGDLRAALLTLQTRARQRGGLR